jgi:Carboxypeptidase regulatory-like domain
MPLRPLALAAAALLLAWAAALPAAAQGPGSVLVQVLAAESGAPLAGAQVRIDGVGRGATDARGVVRVTGLAPGRHRLEVTALDRESRDFALQVGGAEETEVEVSLAPHAVRIAGVAGVAAARPRTPLLRGFYERMERGTNGYFVGREQIDRIQTGRFTDLFRSVPNIQVAHNCAGNVVRFNRATGRPAATLESVAGMPGARANQEERQTEYAECGEANMPDCPPRWFVDGVPYRLEGSPDVVFANREVEGIEMYLSQVPPQFAGGDSTCGIIAVWSREQATTTP